MLAPVTRHRFTAEEYHRLIEAGVFDEDDRVELLDGEVIEVSPIGSRHGAAVRRATYILMRGLASEAIVSVQNPVRISDLSEPQPDLALLKPRRDFYENSHPTPEDVLLILEVAETSAHYDRDVKAPLYAASSIPEVWVLDLSTGFLEVLRQPTPQGYRSILRLAGGERVAPLAFPEFPITVADLLGRSSS